ncbi:beta-mannosidase [Mycobacterium antarcticum]|uniref:hypothetical protein n=1 Tax=unclassified Mycolicibacterium TaxID=2636767 RepID=UPI00239C68EA|nr:MULTISPECIES: hypothetical protein [unclassified Mycolicibacterium]GLP77700.1 beta-mannosidase [Mycolicibacterium sp. TUM20983]GLP81900.1 beta-mannosidase [Mycolicibacterium sp. TUM20984]
MPLDWQAIRCRPGVYAHSSDVSGEWPGSLDVGPATTVAAVFGDVDDPDDFDHWFRTVLEVDEATVVEFGGLTFPATVFVDGVEVGRCESMFMPVRVEFGAGSHEVCVHFASLAAWLAIRRPRGRWRSSLVAAPGMRWARTTLIGRAPVYGPVPAPVGFWRPVVTTPARCWTSHTVSTEPTTGEVRIDGTCGADDGTEIHAAITDGVDGTVTDVRGRVDDGRFTLRAHVAAPRLWWPHGYGPAHCYGLTLSLDGHPVRHRTIGFRRLDVDTGGGGFRVVVNGVAIFCRGATWTPPDPVRLLSDRAAIEELVSTFVDAGANMLRIVGGMVYEQDEFWEVCAERGVMVWQDAMQSTFDPPLEQSDLIADELCGVLDAVSGNPAVTIVSGGSETLQRPEMLGLDREQRTIALIESVLPARVARHSDAHYVIASPSPPPDSDDLAIRPDTGIAHWFGVGGYLRPVADVHTAGVRFAAECLAFSNPPVLAAVERHFGSAAVAGHDPRWKSAVPRDRGSSWDFEDVRDFYAERIFGEDLLTTRRIDPERYLQLGRLAVAEAMRACFAFWRRSDSGCGGALVLTAKDLCPGAGWGLLDVDGTPKPALAVLRRVWAPVGVIVADGGLAGVRIDVHNDTERAISGALRLIASHANGNRMTAGREDVVVPPHSSVTLTDADVTGAFRDLSHAFRFGPATADAIEASFAYDDGTASVSDVMIVNPRSGQPSTGVAVTVTSDGPNEAGDRWLLEVSSPASLRYVTVDAPGWQPSDDSFHLPVGTTRHLLLRRTTATGQPAGTLDSIDLVSPKTFGARP